MKHEATSCGVRQQIMQHMDVLVEREATRKHCNHGMARETTQVPP